MKQLQTVFYVLALPVFILSTGGWLHLVLFDTPGPPASSEKLPLFLAVMVSLFSGTIMAVFGRILFRRNRKRSVFATVAFCLSLLFASYSAEFLARWYVPPWPAMGLHGVSPAVAYEAWAHPNDTGTARQLNTWGQRDRPRKVSPSTDGYRIAFVGDSFLEESASDPVSLAVEEKLSSNGVEVLNLGVSASGPDEYFYRVRSIAIPLKIDHCVLFVYAGNDFAEDARTLDSYAGIVAVYPRDSLFSAFRLRALNHLCTNRNRKVLQAWFASGNLYEKESRLGAAIRNASDKKLRDILYSLQYAKLLPQQRKNLASRLNAPKAGTFFQMLRHPDLGLFRSYYLSSAVWSASVLDGQWPPLSEQNAFFWVSKARNLCDRKHIGFTLVIIPEAFQVDSRMIEQWAPLTNMRQLTAPARTAAHRLLTKAKQAGIRSLDLHDALNDVPGTYLNLDGHWSEKGVQIVAETLTQELRVAMNLPPSRGDSSADSGVGNAQ